MEVCCKCFTVVSIVLMLLTHIICKTKEKNIKCLQANHAIYPNLITVLMEELRSHLLHCLLGMFYLIYTWHTYYDLRFCIFLGCLCVLTICICVNMHFLTLSFDSFPSVCFLSHFGLLFVHFYYYFNLFFLLVF